MMQDLDALAAEPTYFGVLLTRECATCGATMPPVSKVRTVDGVLHVIYRCGLGHVEVRP